MKTKVSRIISTALALLIVLSTLMCAVSVSAATGSPEMIVSSAIGRAGETVAITVKLQNTEKLRSIAIWNITYDSNNFEYLGGEWKLTDAFLQNVDMNNKTAANLYEENRDCNGDIFVIYLHAFDDVLDGDYDVSCNITAKYKSGTTEIAVPISVTAGKITITSAIPGDVNGDEEVTSDDAIYLLYYTLIPDLYPVNQNVDYNLDGEITSDDAIYLLYHTLIPDIYPIIPIKKCNHALEKVAATEATCTENGNIEYWRCTKCGKRFADSTGSTEISLDDTVIAAKGHHEIADEGTLATPTANGYTAGVWCDRCETWISGHEFISPIAPGESNVIYHLWYVKNEDGEIFEDAYLQQQPVNNPYPNKYTEGTALNLDDPNKKVSCPGYDFLGWYEYPETNAKRVYSIPASANGDISVYAVWKKHEYTITYLPDSAGSTLQKIGEEKFTVDKETALQVPSWPNLVWVGWSDEEGNIVRSIPKGTAHDITLTANWMSKRNQTVPNTKYSTSTPAISKFEDDNGLYYAFTYEIGDIQNVPIQQVEDGIDGKGFNLVKGQKHSISKSFTEKIEQGEATNVANTIAKATTKSDSWTLSEDWNESTSFSEEHANEVSQEQSSKAAISLSQTGKYSLSAGVGGSKEHTDEKGNSTKVTKKDEFGISVNVGNKSSIGAELGGNIGIGKKDVASAGINAGISAGNETSSDLGLNYKHSKETTTEDYEKHTDKVSTNWNINEGFETSKSLSASQEFSKSISQSIKDTYKYGETLDYGGSNSNTVSSSNTSSETREYSSSVTYSTESGSELTVNEELTGDADTGFYRKVLAANFKVFAVVIYDVKSGTFSTMTYSLKINDSEHLFTDYSLVSSFNDYENGVLPFEVPTFVGNYLYGIVGASDGLRVNDETGIVEGYGYKDPSTGICYKKYDYSDGIYSEPCDTDVVIPQYTVVNIDSTHKKIVPITGISANAFSGTTVTTVYLNSGITEIPDSAFEGCTNLRYITGSEISSIGKNAFKGCTSLYELCLSEKMTYLGENALQGTDGLTIFASSPELVDSAMASGVKRLTINLSRINGSIDETVLKTPDTMTYFALIGGGKAYTNLSIESTADTTEISNITIENRKDIPLKLSSKNISISHSNIASNGFVMRLEADTANIVLDVNNYFATGSDNAILCKNVNFYEKEGSSAIGRLRINGNILVCGTTTGMQNVVFDSGVHNFVYLTKEEYDNYFNSIKIIFDANNGNCDTQSKDIYIGSAIGELPIPVRDYFTFVGWFTEADSGEQFTEETVLQSGGELTLYAHWTENPLSDWVLASDPNIPTDAAIDKNSVKWKYTFSTSSSSSSTPNGYTYDGRSITSYSSESGPVYSNPKDVNADRKVRSEQYEISRTHYYRYYHYASNAMDMFNSRATTYCSNYHYYDFTYQLYRKDQNGYLQYWHENGPDGANTVKGHYWLVWFEKEWDDIKYGTRWYYQEPIYTYYYHKDNMETFDGDPTGQSGVSNVVKYVRYREK